jgi:ribosomal protein L24
VTQAKQNPFRAGDTVEVLLGDSAGERWVIAVYDAATDSAYIAGWPCTLVTKATEALKLHRAATDEQHASMIADIEHLRGDHGGSDPRAIALRRVREAGGTP